jgi:hypothetical protein
MTTSPGKAPKKEKEKRQTPEERMEALRYNHMMYGPTPGEVRPISKKVNLGTSYLKDPKFQSLMTAFKKGTAFQFNVTDKGKVYTIATDGTHITFDGKAIYYSRTLNKHEDNLLMDRTAVVQYQSTEALVHLAVAVLRHLSELGAPRLVYLNHEFYYGAETLESGAAEFGPNLLIGSFKHQKAAERSRK